MVKGRKSQSIEVSNGSDSANTNKRHPRTSERRIGSLIVTIGIILAIAFSPVGALENPKSGQGRQLTVIDQANTEGGKDSDKLDAQLTVMDVVIVDGDEEADKLDAEDVAYRLGDVFVAWYLMWLTFDELLYDYGTDYPNTIAHQYLLEVGEANYAYRNITALLNVIDRKENEMDFRIAEEDELVLHVRLGDVLTDSQYIDLNASIEDLWNREEGFVCHDADIKFNYNRAEYEELVQRIPEEATENINKCVIVGAGHLTNKKHESRNEEYKELLASLLRSVLGCEVSYYGSDDPDEDLMYMASAYWLITGMGGFAQIAAACVTARRGWGHAIYDKFNGEVSGWNDVRIPKRWRSIHRQEYINWEDVDMEATLL